MENKPPKRLNERHHLFAYLIAAGYTSVQASEALHKQGIGLSVSRLAQVRQKPEFKKLVREIQTEKMGGTVGVVLSRLARSAVPSLDTMDNLRKYAEDDGVKLRAADRLFTAFEKATGLGVQREGQAGPLVQINLAPEERVVFEQAIAEAEGREPSSVRDAEVVDEQASPSSLLAPTAPALPPPRPRAKTIKELMAELGPCEKYVESGAC